MDSERIKKYFWIALTAVIALFSVSVIARNMLHAYKISRRISAMQSEQAEYLRSIERDSTLIERLRYDEYIEQYARERYRMQRPDEQVYIVK